MSEDTIESELAAAKAEVERLTAVRDAADARVRQLDAELHDQRKIQEANAAVVASTWKDHEQQFADMKSKLDTAKAECERLRMYREIAEALISAFLSTNEVVLAHFDEKDQLRGSGQWRLKEIAKAAKRADQANRKAGRAFDAVTQEPGDMRDVREAAERLRGHSLLPHVRTADGRPYFEGDLKLLANAYLVEHPADDGETRKTEAE